MKRYNRLALSVCVASLGVGGVLYMDYSNKPKDENVARVYQIDRELKNTSLGSYITDTKVKSSIDALFGEKKEIESDPNFKKIESQEETRHTIKFTLGAVAGFFGLMGMYSIFFNYAISRLDKEPEPN